MRANMHFGQKVKCPRGLIGRLITVGGGLSMWLRRFLWLDTTRWCSGKAQPERLLLTRGIMKRYAQKKDKSGFFVNMTTVLPLLGLVGNHTRLFRVGGTNQRPVSDPQNLRNGKTAA